MPGIGESGEGRGVRAGGDSQRGDGRDLRADGGGQRGEGPGLRRDGAGQRWEAPASPASRRRLVRAGLLATVLVLVVVVASGLGRGGGLTVEERTPEPPGAPGFAGDRAALDRPAGDGAAPPAGGGPGPEGRPAGGPGVWIARDAAPLPVPSAHAAVWADRSLVVWGAGAEAAAYDLSRRAWRLLEPAPLEPRLGPALVWTGTHVLVWGGELRDGSPARDGAALDPRSGRWLPLPSAPVGLRRPVAVWTGEELLVWGRGGDGPVSGAALDLGSRRWRALPAAPVQPVDVVDGVWTGDDLLVWGRGRDGQFAAAYDPARGAWRTLPEPPLQQPARGAAAWTGQELVIWGRPLRGQDRPAAPPSGAALDPESGRWRLLPPAPGYDRPGTRRGVHGLRAAWTGARVVIVGGYPRSAALAYDPAADAWQALPPLPGLLHPAVAWTGGFEGVGGTVRDGELLVWGGYGPFGPTVELRSWRTVGLGPPGGDARLRTGS